MPAWDELKVVLRRLMDERPNVLREFPDPGDDEGRHPPFQIKLAPWASATAEQLQRRFGDDVLLTVGALPYPSPTPREERLTRLPPGEPLDPEQVETRLDGPATVRSGHMLQHGLLVRNLTRTGIAIATNGQVTAVVVDPASGAVVGGTTMPQALPLIMFNVPPGGSTRVPLLIGTESFRRELGYALPPGEWGILVSLGLEAGPHPSERRLTPVLPLTVTA